MAILDLDVPGLDYPDVAELGGASRILTLAAERSDENSYRALRLGASGLLTRAGAGTRPRRRRPNRSAISP